MPKPTAMTPKEKLKWLKLWDKEVYSFVDKAPDDFNEVDFRSLCFGWGMAHGLKLEQCESLYNHFIDVGRY